MTFIKVNTKGGEFQNLQAKDELEGLGRTNVFSSKVRLIFQPEQSHYKPRNGLGSCNCFNTT